VYAGTNLTYTITVTNLGPAAAQNVVVFDTLPAGVTFVSASSGAAAGNTGGAYTRDTDTLLFTFAAGTRYAGINFGDVPENVFTTDGQQTALPGSTVCYTHTFIAGTAGRVTFTTSSAPTPRISGWSAVLYHDLDGNGRLDGPEPVLSGPITVAAGEKVNLLVKVFVPVNAPFNAQGQLTVTAAFEYVNAAPPMSASYVHTDLTIVGTPTTAGLMLTKVVDRATAYPGDTLTYTVTYANQSSGALSNVVIYDATPAFTTFVNAANGPLPPDFTGVTIAKPDVGAKGAIQWSFTGSLAPGTTGTITYVVILE
jgi:uncharacterized repeat protein (TIGR01451 family)